MVIEYRAKTWTCTNCGYKYSGTVPLSENLEAQKTHGISGDTCPSCGQTGTLQKETVTEEKALVTELEQADVDSLQAALIGEPVQKIVTGKTTRTETPTEKNSRIENDVNRDSKIPDNQKNAVITERKSAEAAMEVEVLTVRDETPTEKNTRISAIVKEMKPKTAEQIAALRAVLEDI